MHQYQTIHRNDAAMYHRRLPLTLFLPPLSLIVSCTCGQTVRGQPSPGHVAMARGETR